MQMHALEPWWRDHHRLWVTFDLPDARSVLEEEEVVWAHHPTTRNIRNALANLRLAWKLLRERRPDLVVSNGAGVAFPFFLVARLLRIPAVYVEVVDRVESPTLTGRLCYPLADLFLLQWPEQGRFYPKGRVIGRLI